MKLIFGALLLFFILFFSETQVSGSSTPRLLKRNKKPGSSSQNAGVVSNIDLNALPEQVATPKKRGRPKMKTPNLNKMLGSSDSPAVAEAREITKKPTGELQFPPLEFFEHVQGHDAEQTAREHESYKHFQEYTGFYVPLAYPPPSPDNNHGAPASGYPPPPPDNNYGGYGYPPLPPGNNYGGYGYPPPAPGNNYGGYGYPPPAPGNNYGGSGSGYGK